ncbi:MAG: 4-alpha-glucanotransferase [Clostridia bacterium]|jgi:4-alpha-glucanotransferase|nr:4-alpha-glucanotransferase [Clostridia bacterium]MDH7573677.1 4-alpha-glucanotransferase [Clostridia bacterium]
MPEELDADLYRLALAYRVQPVYRDAQGHRRRADPEALLAVLRALGAPVERVADAAPALEDHYRQQARRLCPPVTVVWSPGPAAVTLAAPGRPPADRAECQLVLENGEERHWRVEAAAFSVARRYRARRNNLLLRLALPSDLPWGYHRLRVRLGSREGSTLLIVAPRRAYPTPKGRAWGIFLPLYALRSERSWGVGDFSDLSGLASWVAGLGGGTVGTLPLLAAFLDRPLDPSPYTPVSRLFWNELYLDVSRAPELAACPQAREVVASADFRRELNRLAAEPGVDYRRVLNLKRRVLELLARECFARRPQGSPELAAWAAGHPRARDYARFRAAVELRGETWPSWPERMREGRLEEGDFSPEGERYHLYVQWLAERQLQDLVRGSGAGLYLDLPLGVHPHGYDVWREREAFATEVSCGAPPDPFFRQGQNWGVPPLHPGWLREQGYAYYLACLRHHLRYARVLRLDHVLGLHRQFWIPKGMDPRQGVYVRYRAEEFYALLSLESHRHRAIIVGEDLGLLPRPLRAAMKRHGLWGMYVFQLEHPFSPGPGRAVPARSLACLNTHDTLPFAGFWDELGSAGQSALKEWLRRSGVLRGEPGEREQVLAACLRYLAAGPAGLLMINLEDLWLETEPQNVPGTGWERPNWQRRARYGLEEIRRLPAVRQILEEVNALRSSPPAE